MTSTRTGFADPRGFPFLGEALPNLELSYEVFPPKNEAMAGKLLDAVDRLNDLPWAYISVTCGAGGGEKTGTAEWVQSLQQRTGTPTVAHFTCASLSRGEADDIARAYWDSGIRRLVALRGDRPKDGSALAPADGYAYAVDLVRGLRKVAPFDISVAGYPEAHPEARSAKADLANLKAKVDAGAARVITQYCFDTDRILRFRDAMTALGIHVPLVVGIMPIHNFTQIQRFSAGCGAGIPDWLPAMFEGIEDDPVQAYPVAASLAAEQMRRLIAGGIHQFHIYTLNRAELTLALCRLLGIAGRSDRAAA
ncbi:MAG: methylenetetrahydrofolate reductase [Geminicoccaceae bacterium]